jgi:TonB-linked SusC/RagA family outer membrane protein
MKKNLLSLLLLCLFTLGSVFAQSRKITGTVTDADDGQPLPGVSVKIQGAAIGTQTGPDGKYSLSIQSVPKSLTFSYIGFVSQTISVGARSVIDVKLHADSKALGEVVVVGYGTQERRALTGSVTKVGGDDIGTLPAPSFDKDLAGRASGVRVTESSGLLGSAPVIRIRGDNSLSGGQTPLFVLDGIPIITGNNGTGSSPQNPLADINPEDIQSIEILKDGAASAIYGSRAAAGVILITTKKGKADKPSVNYNAWVGVSTTSKRLSILNAADFITISNEKFVNSGFAPAAFPTLDPSGQPYDTNWQNVVFRKGFQQNHALSFSGGTETSNYYLSAGYSDLTGDLVANGQKKYNVRANFEKRTLNNILTIGLTSSVAYQANTGFNAGTNSLSGNVTNALLVFPNVPVFNSDGSYNISADGNSTQLGTKLGQGANTRQIDNNYTNIAYVLDNNIFRSQNTAINGTAYLSAKIVTGLELKTQLGINALYEEDYTYLSNQHGDGRSANGSVTQDFSPSFNYDWVNTLAYNHSFGSHSLQFVAGDEFQKFRFRISQLSGSNISNPFFGPNQVISNTYTTQNIFGDETENSIRSFFGRVNYNFKNKYLLSVTYREDYISQLGIASEPAKLPGVSVGWRISDEGFFKNAESLKFVDDLKLRAGYAKTGNSAVPGGSYPYANLYSPVSYGTTSSIAFTTLGNADLKYETVNKVDIGLDLSLFKGRISFTADYYKNTDDNLIQAVPIAPSLGVPGNTILENIGSMYNRGYEFAVSTQNIKGRDFSWSSNFNISFNKNEVTSLNGGLDVLNTYNFLRVGLSKNQFYGYQYLGVNPANGNPLYQKVNGQVIQGNIPNSTYYNYDPANPTALTTQNTLAAADKVPLGDAIPTYFGGFNNTFTYKGFDLGIFLTFSGGNKVYNATRQEDLDTYAFNNNGTEIMNRWTPTNTNTDVPKLYYGSSAGNFTNVTGNAISRYLEDGRFIRAQEITLGYSLPKSAIKSILLSKVRVYAQIQNAFIITPYKGLDPEVSNTGTSVDFNANPRPRTFVVGLNVGF